LTKDIPPFERPERPDRSRDLAASAGDQVAHRRYNPLLIFGIPLFGVLAAYLAVVVVTLVFPLIVPGEHGPLASIVPKEITGTDPEVADIDQRINILLMGLDLRRDEPDDLPARTDTVMILTIDPYSKTAGAFSIPRDTWLEIPDGHGGYYNDRINVAYEYGQYDGRYNGTEYQGKGDKVIGDTIMHNFGIPIDHYVLLNFNNFIEIIDDLGGVDVNVPEYAYDSAYHDCNNCAYFPVEFVPGIEHMNGERALAYARIRKSDNDFKRIERQQTVVRATAKRATDLGTLLQSNPIALFEKFKSAIKTDISNSRALGLAKVLRGVGIDNVRMVSMAPPAVYPCGAPCGGAAVLLWDPIKVEELKGQVFNDGRLQGEGAIVEVLNGTDTPKLAEDFASFLRSQGMPSEQVAIDELQDGPLYASTLIVNFGDKSYTTEQLAKWLNLPPSRVKTGTDPEAQEFTGRQGNVLVILGADASLPESDAVNLSLRGTATTGGY